MVLLVAKHASEWLVFLTMPSRLAIKRTVNTRELSCHDRRYDQ